jgi:hypothetical protein
MKSNDGYAVKTLMVADDWSYLCEMEVAAIRAFGTMAPGGYNLTAGGEGTLGFKATESQRKRQSDARRGVMNIGNKHSLGAVRSPETRAKLSAAMAGNKNGLGIVPSEEKKMKLSTAQKGKPRAPLSEEHKKKIGDAQRGRSLSDAHKAKISATKRNAGT